MKTISILVINLLVIYQVIAQINSGNDSILTISDSTNQAVIITKDRRLDEIVQKQKDINILKQSIPGYRIQVYFGGDRQKANELKEEFIVKHANMNAYVSYQQPNFKVRVGDFRTRLEANKILKQIANDYSSCFIVPEEINVKEFK